MTYYKQLLALLMTALFLVACGADSVVSAIKSAISFDTAKVWLEKVNFVASDDVNDTSPITVHIVIPYKPELLAQLLKMDADTYFKNIDQLKKDYAGYIDVFSWDIIPKQHLNDVPVNPSKVTGEGVLIFAHYSSPGLHRATIAEEKEITIQLDKLDFKVIPIK